MSTKIFTGTCAVLLAVLLLASVPVAAAGPEDKRAPQAERDFYQCLEGATILPPADDVKTCMVQKGDSDQEITGVIKSLPDQELFAPYTGYQSHGG